jgi:hypothetical protein
VTADRVLIRRHNVTGERSVKLNEILYVEDSICNATDVGKNPHAGLRMMGIHAEIASTASDDLVDGALCAQDGMRNGKTHDGRQGERRVTPVDCLSRSDERMGAQSGTRDGYWAMDVVTLRAVAEVASVGEQALVAQTREGPTQAPRKLPAAAGFCQAVRAKA